MTLRVWEGDLMFERPRKKYRVTESKKGYKVSLTVEGDTLSETIGGVLDLVEGLAGLDTQNEQEARQQ